MENTSKSLFLFSTVVMRRLIVHFLDILSRLLFTYNSIHSNQSSLFSVLPSPIRDHTLKYVHSFGAFLYPLPQTDGEMTLHILSSLLLIITTIYHPPRLRSYLMYGGL